LAEDDVTRNSLILALALFLLACVAAVFLPNRSTSAVHAATSAAPVYDKSGDLLPPSDYRQWIYLSSGLDMSYNPKSSGAGDDSMSMFDNVFVNPQAYARFAATGTWPDKTMLVLESREGKNKGSINLRGHYQGEGLMGIEVHVKDEARFPGGWAFFAFDSPTVHGTLIPQKAPCYTCHAAHGAVDTTFVQFYPTLLPIARKKGTLSESFLKESTEPAAK
jgi:hypothetical protein